MGLNTSSYEGLCFLGVLRGSTPLPELSFAAPCADQAVSAEVGNTLRPYVRTWMSNSSPEESHAAPTVLHFSQAVGCRALAGEPEEASVLAFVGRIFYRSVIFEHLLPERDLRHQRLGDWQPCLT